VTADLRLPPSRSFLARWLPLLVAWAVYVPLSLGGIQWGLPGRWVDAYLFGNRPVWTGQQLTDLLPKARPQVGADVDPNPLDRHYPVLLNGTDAQRAEIVVRYRLYSAQPDEMITLRSLRQMKPASGDLDPRLYQYGGVWIYGSGVVMGLSHLFGLVDLRQSLAWYLDHPAEFGRFYVPLRLISVAGGMVLLLAVGRFLSNRSVPVKWRTAALLGMATMPGIIAFSHEAKPHILGLALAWCAFAVPVIGRRTAVICGGLAGLAMGTVVSMAVVPVGVMAALCLARQWRWAILAAGAAAGAYAATNPYVVWHLLTGGTGLGGQLGNSAAMYHARMTVEGLWNAAYLAIYASPVLVPAIALAIVRPGRISLPGGVWVAPMVSGLLMLAIFAALAEGKPPEYARFALLPVSLALVWMCEVASQSGRQRFSRWGITVVVGLGLLVGAAGGLVQSLVYFSESRVDSSRRASAADVARYSPTVLSVEAEPAPYCLPPVDLFAGQLWLVGPRPRETPPSLMTSTPGDRLVMEGDWPFLQMTWARRGWSLVHYGRGSETPLQSDGPAARP
jgi:hypothetical protein